MKCFIKILFLLMIVAVYRIDEVKCKPRKLFRKNLHYQHTKLPLKHHSFILTKVTPFGKYGFKHIINKRQAEIPCVPTAIPVIEGSLDDIAEKKEVPLECNLEPKIIITSVVQPVDIDKPLETPGLITLPGDHKILEIPVNVIAENEPKPELIPPKVEDIIPKPIETLIPPEEPVESNVLMNTVVETSEPPLVRIPIYRNPSYNFLNPVLANGGKTLLYTDITQLPLNPAPVVIPDKEVNLPPSPLVPVPVSPPSETPNFFVKGSRLVLYFGSMMLQMLSRLVNGGFNINQIPIPIIPGIQ